MMRLASWRRAALTGVQRRRPIPLQKVSPPDLDQLYAELDVSGGRGRRPLSAKTVLNVHRVLHKALGDAVRQGRIPHNPAARVQTPSAPKARTEVWTVEHLRTFLRQVRDERLYALWLLFATTGMRRGEAVGLAWPDLALHEGRLRVTMTLGIVDGRATWKPGPKSAAGERTMSLDPTTAEALRHHQETHARERDRAGAGWQRRQRSAAGATISSSPILTAA